jgi:CDP-glucose 4,6-dehydratase
MKNLFKNIYHEKKVLVTGHTGFKGSWLCCWLKLMGASVSGYSLAPNTDPSHITLLNPVINEKIDDINNRNSLESYINKIRPDIIFHMAAQPLVRLSYEDPVYTYSTNIMGTVNLLEATRLAESVKAVIIVTSDKCYENREWLWGYRENDPMGGYDPYSSSKGCTELVTSSYRNSFFHINDYEKKHSTLIASTRAGNVIGGGDWADDRLIPDIVRAVEKNEPIMIRNPFATRPWQHVLEPLSGYLLLGQKLLEKEKACADGWNFGPASEEILNVQEVVELSSRHWDRISYEITADINAPHEAKLLKLDCSKANTLLKWLPVWTAEDAIHYTIDWYKKYYENNSINTESDIKSYVDEAGKKKLVWT